MAFESKLQDVSLSVGGTTQQIFQKTAPLGEKVKISLNLQVSGLDFDVQIQWLQGNEPEIAKMGRLLDADENPIITDLTNDVYYLIAESDAPYIGIQLIPLTATTGTIAGKFRL